MHDFLFFMKSKFKVRLLHKNSVCSSTTPGNRKPGLGKLPIFSLLSFNEKTCNDFNRVLCQDN